MEESKPAPDIFEIVLKKLKIEGVDAVAIGDTPYDAEAAGKAGIATIGVFVGGGGLGVLIYRGLQTIDTQTLLAGAIPAALLAIVLEVGLSLWERRLARATASK